MEYSLEDEIEASRLEEQVFQENYTIKKELGKFSFKPDEYVMDAGCGSGVLARELVQHHRVKRVDGLDGSDLRIRQATQFAKEKGISGISFFCQDLSRLDAQFFGKYDTVICRYVLEHVTDPVLVISNLRKALKNGGRLIIYELDGVFMNLYSENPLLHQYMEELRGKINFDLFIGRKLPAYLKRAGFSEVNWDAELLACKGRRLTEEKGNTVKRFSALSQFLSKVFGSSQRKEEFIQLYLDEMSKEENTLVFTKYICEGKNV